MGHMFCDEVGFEPDERERGTHYWWMVWSAGYRSSRGYVWEMLPQVAEALELLGWVAPKSTRLTEELPPAQSLVEGAVRQVRVNAYERNAAARSRCVEHYGASCKICGFDFGAVYGAFADGFIHVHHIKPLSGIGVEYQVDPIKHLVPVCPNCHAIIHLGGRSRSIEEVKDLLGRADETAE